MLEGEKLSGQPYIDYLRKIGYIDRLKGYFPSQPAPVNREPPETEWLPGASYHNQILKPPMRTYDLLFG